MQPTDSLFKLIKSLSKSEKGYIKKLTQAFAGDKQSINSLLFDAIDKQEAYDEAALLKKFRNQSFVKQFSVTKKGLFEHILKALRQYHSHNKLIAANDHIENAQILFGKLLNEEGKEELTRAKKLAQQLERPLKEMEIIFHERRFYYENATADWDELIKAGIEAEQATLEWLKQESAITEIYYLLQKFIRHERIVRTPEHEAYLDQLVQRKELNLAYDSLNFEAKVRYNMIFKIYHQLKNQDQTSRQYMKKVLDEYRMRPAVMEAEPKRYLLALNNYLSICSKMNDYKEIEICLSEVDESILEYDLSSQIFWFDLKANFNILVLVNRCQWDKLEALMQELLFKLTNFEHLINPVRVLVIRFNCLISSLVLGKHERCLDLLNIILNNKSIELRKDLYAQARIYNLMVHFDLNNALLLESVSRSAKNFLQSRDMYYELERVIVNYFMKLINCANKEEQKIVLKSMIQEADEVVLKNPLEKNLLQTLDIHSWANAHIQGISMKTYIEQQMLADKNK